MTNCTILHHSRWKETQSTCEFCLIRGEIAKLFCVFTQKISYSFSPVRLLRIVFQCSTTWVHARTWVACTYTCTIATSCHASFDNTCMLTLNKFYGVFSDNCVLFCKVRWPAVSGMWRTNCSHVSHMVAWFSDSYAIMTCCDIRAAVVSLSIMENCTIHVL